jgi:hypothetical protein
MGAMFDEILSYGGQGGLRELLRYHKDHVLSIPVEDPFIRLDADPVEDLLLLREKYVKEPGPPQTYKSPGYFQQRRISSDPCPDR